MQFIAVNSKFEIANYVWSRQNWPFFIKCFTRNIVFQELLCFSIFCHGVSYRQIVRFRNVSRSACNQCTGPRMDHTLLVGKLCSAIWRKQLVIVVFRVIICFTAQSHKLQCIFRTFCITVVHYALNAHFVWNILRHSFFAAMLQCSYGFGGHPQINSRWKSSETSRSTKFFAKVLLQTKRDAYFSKTYKSVKISGPQTFWKLSQIYDFISVHAPGCFVYWKKHEQH